MKNCRIGRRSRPQASRTRTPWFTPEGFAKLQLATTDPELTGLGYDEWRRLAEESMRAFEANGVQVERVEVDVDALIELCLQRGLPIDGANACWAACALSAAQEDRETDDQMLVSVRFDWETGAVDVVPVTPPGQPPPGHKSRA